MFIKCHHTEMKKGEKNTPGKGDIGNSSRACILHTSGKKTTHWAKFRPRPINNKGKSFPQRGKNEVHEDTRGIQKRRKKRSEL